MDWRYDWDARKRESNLRNHNVDFMDACEAFGPEMLVRIDTRQDYGEERFVGMAPLEGRLLVIVFTYRSDNVIRIISARKANHREQKIYLKARADQPEETGRDDRR